MRDIVTEHEPHQEIEYLVVKLHMFSMGKFAFSIRPDKVGEAVAVNDYPEELQFLLRQLGIEGWDLSTNVPFSLSHMVQGEEGVIVFKRKARRQAA